MKSAIKSSPIVWSVAIFCTTMAMNSTWMMVLSTKSCRAQIVTAGPTGASADLLPMTSTASNIDRASSNFSQASGSAAPSWSADGPSADVSADGPFWPRISCLSSLSSASRRSTLATRGSSWMLSLTSA